MDSLSMRSVKATTMRRVDDSPNRSRGDNSDVQHRMPGEPNSAAFYSDNSPIKNTKIGRITVKSHHPAEQVDRVQVINRSNVKNPLNQPMPQFDTKTHSLIESPNASRRQTERNAKMK